MPWFAWLLSFSCFLAGCDATMDMERKEAGKIMLGKKLFFEPRLSLERNTSCATCHRPENGFAEPVKTRSVGFGIYRNTPGLWAVGQRKKLHWDGGVPDLESQAVGPLQSMDELGLNLKMGVVRLKEDRFYQDAFQFVFGEEPDVSFLVQALAAFQRSLDPLLHVSEEIIHSKNAHFTLFMKVGCGHCHMPPYFMKDDFVKWQTDTLDPGRGRITGFPDDMGKFRIPSLWAVGLTSPYFHDGRHASLKDAILGHGAKMQTLSLSQTDSLVWFLKSLTPAIFPTTHF